MDSGYMSHNGGDNSVSASRPGEERSPSCLEMVVRGGGVEGGAARRVWWRGSLRRGARGLDGEFKRRAL